MWGAARPRLSYPSLLYSTRLGLGPPSPLAPQDGRCPLPGLCQGLPSVVACLLPLPVACGDLAFFNLPFISRPRPSEFGFDVGPAPRGVEIKGFLGLVWTLPTAPSPGGAQRSPGHPDKTLRMTPTGKRAGDLVPDLQAHGGAAAWAPKWWTVFRNKSFVTTPCDLLSRPSPPLLTHRPPSTAPVQRSTRRRARHLPCIT